MYRNDFIYRVGGGRKQLRRNEKILRGLLMNIISPKISVITICMEIQKTSNSQSNLEKEEWNWRNQPA